MVHGRRRCRAAAITARGTLAPITVLARADCERRSQGSECPHQRLRITRALTTRGCATSGGRTSTRSQRRQRRRPSWRALGRPSARTRPTPSCERGKQLGSRVDAAAHGIVRSTAPHPLRASHSPRSRLLHRPASHPPRCPGSSLVQRHAPRHAADCRHGARVVRPCGNGNLPARSLRRWHGRLALAVPSPARNGAAGGQRATVVVPARGRHLTERRGRRHGALPLRIRSEGDDGAARRDDECMLLTRADGDRAAGGGDRRGWRHGGCARAPARHDAGGGHGARMLPARSNGDLPRCRCGRHGDLAV